MTLGKKTEEGFTTKLKRDRDTKGTFVYKDDATDAPIRSLYISKGAFGDEAPETITVKVEAA